VKQEVAFLKKKRPLPARFLRSVYLPIFSPSGQFLTKKQPARILVKNDTPPVGARRRQSFPQQRTQL
jgi:hypothetical protein